MNMTTRRTFIVQTLAITAAASLPEASFATASPEQQTSGKSLFDKMKWLNEPASAKESGNQIEILTRAKTDFWRKTFYGYITDNGHFFYMPIAGDFVLESRVTGQYADLYDQAGLMVRVDGENWMKCGIELVDGVEHASVVMTRDFSDWSTVGGIASKTTWWRVVRKGDSLESLYSLDGKTYTSIRLGYLQVPKTVNAGIMCASPEGKGFKCSFDELRLTQSA
jgi:regulation of enolase protein 1 (concanavalin A-like superfamily)